MRSLIFLLLLAALPANAQDTSDLAQAMKDRLDFQFVFYQDGQMISTHQVYVNWFEPANGTFDIRGFCTLEGILRSDLLITSGCGCTYQLVPKKGRSMKGTAQCEDGEYEVELLY